WRARRRRQTGLSFDALRVPHVRLHPVIGFKSRLLGLLAYPHWGGQPWGLLLTSCRAIHTLGLSCPIDVVFLGVHRGRPHIVRVDHALRPGRVAFCRAARAVVELPAGYCSAPARLVALSRQLSLLPIRFLDDI